MLSTFCFASIDTYKSMGTIGSILVALCVIIPTWYFNSFRNSIKEQTKNPNSLWEFLEKQMDKKRMHKPRF